MTVIWSGITEQGAIVPVQVDEAGKVVATASVPDEYVLRSGDTMTGPLVLPSDPTQNLQAATKQYVDSNLGVPYFAGARVFAAGTTESAYNCNVTSSEVGVYNLEFFARPSNALYLVQITADYRPNRIVCNCTYDSGGFTSSGFLYYIHEIVNGTSQASAHSVMVWEVP